MPSCKSWRPKDHAKHQPPLKPGECRSCWTPCRNPVDRGTVRCADCLELLLSHPDSAVRRALINEEGVTLDILIRLAQDDEYAVALAAEGALELADSSETNTQDPGFDPWADR
ncbi:hypothetical protein ACFVAJ_16705 [Agromyces sp. NPDC057679]|uniref:hypothetical protein n=1 Tax=Agromyces sp. NPDC057679 TaxID=3346207 RepID=UPI00366FCDB8